MPQNTPTPPASPNQVLTGDQIANIVNQALSSSLAGARQAVAAQLEVATAERNALQAQVDNASGSTRRQLQSRLNDANVKVEKLQQAVDKLDARTAPNVNIGPAIGNRGIPVSPGFDPTPMVVSVLGILFVAFPLTIIFGRILFRRMLHGAPPQMNADSTRRFDRLEQSVDAIAIEVERISENQRYLTKLLAEPKVGAVPPGSVSS